MENEISDNLMRARFGYESRKRRTCICRMATRARAIYYFRTRSLKITLFFFNVDFSDARTRTSYLSISKPYTHINDNTVTERHCQSNDTMQVDLRFGR